MKKSVKILIIIAAILIILFAIGKIVYNYIEDRAVSMLVEDRINDMLDTGEVTLTELEGALDKPAGQAETPQAAEPPETPSVPESEKSSAPEKKPAQTGNASNNKSRGEIVKETTKKVNQSITRADKQEIMNLIGSRLSSADISYLMGLLKGGLTAEETAAAKKIALSKFTREEISRVQSFYYKYISLVP